MELPGPTVWLGGGTGSGKTTVARAFASRHGLRVFPVDSFWYSHAGRLSEADRTPDAQWLGQTPREQAAEFEAVARSRWPLVLADLAALPSRPPVIVEGPQLLPDLVPQGAAAVFLAPTPAFQRAVLVRRPLPPTADAVRALENRIEKDRLFTVRVEELAAAHGQTVLRVDGVRPVEEILAELEVRFADVTGVSCDVATLGAARAWENGVFADNVAAWLASPDAPAGERGAFSFACECGRRGCAARVDLTLSAYRSISAVMADGH